MTTWLVEYVPYTTSGGGCAEGEERTIPCFRIFPEDDPERWLAETNSDLPYEVQEQAALVIAAALSNALGRQRR